MEKVLIFGPSLTELVSFVERFPKEGEEIHPLRTEERISGAGYIAAHLFSMINMPVLLYTNPGSGVYGERVSAALNAEKIEYISRNEETAGCLYTLVDSKGNALRMAAAGSEYGFLPFDSAEEGESVLLDGTYLYDADSELLPDVMLEEGRTVLFCPHYAGIEADPRLFEALLKSGPILHLSEEEAASYGGQEKDLRKIAADLNAVTHQPVIILRSDGSGYFHDEADDFQMKSFLFSLKDRTGMAETHAAAYLMARNAGADNRSAMAFAGECAALAGQTELSVIEEKEKETVRQLLIQAILTKSFTRLQDFLS